MKPSSDIYEFLAFLKKVSSTTTPTVGITSTSTGTTPSASEQIGQLEQQQITKLLSSANKRTVRRRPSSSKKAGTLRRLQSYGDDKLAERFYETNGNIDSEERRKLFGTGPYEFIGERSESYPVYKNIVRYDLVDSERRLYTLADDYGRIRAMSSYDELSMADPLCLVVQLPVSITKRKLRKYRTTTADTVDLQTFPNLDERLDLRLSEFPDVPILRAVVVSCPSRRTATAFIRCEITHYFSGLDGQSTPSLEILQKQQSLPENWMPIIYLEDKRIAQFLIKISEELQKLGIFVVETGAGSLTPVKHAKIDIKHE